MSRSVFETQFLVNEAQSLLSRLKTIKPFALNMPMVPAASVSDEALKGVTDLIVGGYKELRRKVLAYIAWVKDPLNKYVTPAAVQARFSILKLRFNALLDQLDIFADVLSQRAEHETGVWVAGLDALAEDAINVKHQLYQPPPLICYLERGHGAAIRRARTRLPGGDMNPVAVIQVPRERMVGSGIAASLIHEVGHQGAALLGLVESMRNDLRKAQAASSNKTGWDCLYRWISEIVADLWSTGHLGIGATLGLMNVVSLPRYFVFRVDLNDPHPFPWIRVKLSLAFGAALFPHPQWYRFSRLWDKLYPTNNLDEQTKNIIHELKAVIPDFVNLALNHMNSTLREYRLYEIFPWRERQPAHLQYLYNMWRFAPDKVTHAPPSLVFAVIGQARADALINSQTESEWLSRWLTNWAFQRSESRSRKELVTIYDELKQLVKN